MERFKVKKPTEVIDYNTIQPLMFIKMLRMLPASKVVLLPENTSYFFWIISGSGSVEIKHIAYMYF